MSLLATINEKRRARKTVLDEANKILATAVAAKRDLSGEEETEWNKRHEDGDKMLKEISRLEKQHEANLSLTEKREDSRTGGREDTDPTEGRGLSSEQRAQWDDINFRAWVCGGVQGMSQQQMAYYQRMQDDLKKLAVTDETFNLRALSDVTGSLGAYTVPQGFVYKLEVALLYYGGMLESSDYIDTDLGNLLPWPSVNDTANSGEVISENTQVSGSSGGAAEQDPGFGVINFSAYMQDSGLVPVPLQLMQDSAFDVERYFIGDVPADAEGASQTAPGPQVGNGDQGLLAVRIGRKLNNLATVGTGSNQPTGLLTAAPVGVNGTSPTAITYNNLLDLEHSVDPAYRRNRNGRPISSWMFADSTLKAIKKLTDGNGRPLFIAGGVSQGIQDKSPDTIDGYPYVINQDFPALGSSAKALAFGCLKKYKIRRVRNLQMVRLNERLIDRLQIGFMAWQRFDGNLVDAGTHPIKLYQCSAT